MQAMHGRLSDPARIKPCSISSESLGVGVQVSRGVIPKCRRKVIYGTCGGIGGGVRTLAEQKEGRVEEGT